MQNVYGTGRRNERLLTNRELAISLYSDIATAISLNAIEIVISAI